MTNYTTGHDAEKRASEYLQSQGFKILELNWKTRYCEIDIIADKKKAIYFIEVKYRSTANQGFGTDYITLKKLSQMSFAAEMWVTSHDWRGKYQLAVISMDADEIDFIDEVITC